MEIKMKRKLSLLILTILSTTLLINCGGKDNAGGQGVLIAPTVSKTITSTQTVQQNQTQKQANTIELALTGWSGFTYRKLIINAGHVTGSGNTKVEFCMLETDGEDLGSVIGSGIEILDEASRAGERYFIEALKEWGYWNIVNNKNEAHFIIVFNIDKKAMLDKSANVTFITREEKEFKKSNSYRASTTAFNGYNAFRAVANKIVGKYFKKEFK